MHFSENMLREERALVHDGGECVPMATPRDNLILFLIFSSPFSTLHFNDFIPSGIFNP